MTGLWGAVQRANRQTQLLTLRMPGNGLRRRRRCTLQCHTHVRMVSWALVSGLRVSLSGLVEAVLGRQMFCWWQWLVEVRPPKSFCFQTLEAAGWIGSSLIAFLLCSPDCLMMEPCAVQCRMRMCAYAPSCVISVA